MDAVRPGVSAPIAASSNAPGSAGRINVLQSIWGQRLRLGVDIPIDLEEIENNASLPQAPSSDLHTRALPSQDPQALQLAEITEQNVAVCLSVLVECGNDFPCALEKLLSMLAGAEASRGVKRPSVTVDEVDGGRVKRERACSSAYGTSSLSAGGQLAHRGSGIQALAMPAAGAAYGAEEIAVALCPEEKDALMQIPNRSVIAFDFDGVFHRSVQEVAPGKYYAVRTQHPKDHRPFTDMLRRAESFLSRGYQLQVVTANNPKVVVEFFQNPTLKQLYPRLYSTLNGGRNNVVRGSGSDGKFSDLRKITARIFYDDSITTLEPLVRNIKKAGEASPLQAIFQVFPIKSPALGKPQPVVALHWKK